MDAKTQDAAGPELREGERAPHINAATFERTDTGIRVCFGHHARSEDCEWEEYVPATPREPALAAPTGETVPGLWDVMVSMALKPRQVCVSATDEAQVAALLAARVPAPSVPQEPRGESGEGMVERAWQPIATAPTTGRVRTVLVRGEQSEVYFAHYACDLSGEEQPSFRGWFRRSGPQSFVQCFPTHWLDVDEPVPLSTGGRDAD